MASFCIKTAHYPFNEILGFYDDDDDDFDFGGGGGGGMMNQMGNMNAMGGGGGMMNRRGNMRQQQRMGGRMNTMNMMRDRFAQPGSHYTSKTGHSVHMRGLPFQALETDISDVRFQCFYISLILRKPAFRVSDQV